MDNIVPNSLLLEELVNFMMNSSITKWSKSGDGLSLDIGKAKRIDVSTVIYVCDDPPLLRCIGVSLKNVGRTRYIKESDLFTFGVPEHLVIQLLNDMNKYAVSKLDKWITQVLNKESL